MLMFLLVLSINIFTIYRYDTSAKESSFSVGLQGVEEEGIKPVKDAVWETLTKVSRYLL